MANKGLKEENTMLEFELSDVKVSIDLSKENKNIIATILLGLDIGIEPINLPIYYNHQNSTENGYFGEGFRFLGYKKIESSGAHFITKNSDGSTDIYNFLSETSDEVKYQNPIDLSVLTISYGEDYDTYEIRDKYNNFIDYDEDEFTYAGRVVVLNQFSFSYYYTNTYFHIINNSTNLLRLNLTNGKVSSFIYYENRWEFNENILYQGTITYTNNKITNISVTRNNTTVKNISISYNNGIKFIDQITIKMLEINTSTTDTIIVKEGYPYHYETTTIAYDDNKTIVTDNLGLSKYYYFDNNYLLEQIIDFSKFYVGSVKYDSETRKKIYENGAVFQKSTSAGILSMPTMPTPIPDSPRPLEYYQSTMYLTPVNVTDADFSYLLSNIYKNTSNGYIRYTKEISVIGLDSYSLSIWAKYLSGSGNLKIILNVAGKLEQLVFTENDLPTTYYKFIYLGVTQYESASFITFEIEITGDLEIEFGRAEIFNNNLKTNYAYQNTNLVLQENGLNSSCGNYNYSNLIDGSYGSNQSSSFYHYNNNMVDIEYKPYKVKEETSHFYNKISSKRLKDDYTLMWEESNTYNSNKDLASTTDKFGYASTFAYQNHNMISAKNPLNTYTYFNYDGFDELTSIYKNASYPIIMSYLNNRLLNQVSLPNSSYYSFTYDSYKRLSSVSYNGIILEQYTYNQNNLLASITRGTDVYTINYNTNFDIDTIELNGNVIYRFNYDDKSRIISVGTVPNNIIKTFSYDNKDNLLSIIYQNNYHIDYIYHQNKLAYKNYAISNDKLYVESIGVSSAIAKNPLNLENYAMSTENISGTGFNYGSVLKGKYYNVIPSISQGNDPNTSLGNISVINTTGGNGILSYQSGLYQTDDTRSVGIELWFNIRTLNAQSHIFTIMQDNSPNARKVYCFIYSDRIIIRILNAYGNMQAIHSESVNFELNKWYFIGFSYEYYCDEENERSQEEYIYHINFNGKNIYKSFTNQAYQLGIISPATYYIGCRADTVSQYRLVGYVTALSISNGRLITESDLAEYYHLTKEFIFDSNDLDMATTSSASIDYKKDLLANYDIIPLHNSVISLKGKRPSTYDYTKAGSFIHDNFHYSDVLKIKSYSPHMDLIYDYNMTNTASIVLDCVYEEKRDRCVVICFSGSNSTTITLLICGDELKVEARYYGQVYTQLVATGLSVSLNNTHTIGFTYSITNNILSFIVFRDTLSNSGSINLIGSLGDIKLSIGKNPIFYDGDTEDYHVFDGNIHMVVVGNNYMCVQDYSNVKQNLLYYSQIVKYDKFGRLIVKEINKKTDNIIRKEYSYNKDRVISETFGNNTRSYTYNALGFITNIADSTFGSHSYVYDEYDRLITEDSNTSYDYDKEGNIISAGSDSFTYDNNKLLQYVNNDLITYSSAYGFLPVSYKNYSYSYDGKRLKQITKTLNNSSIVIVNTYNEKGLRIKKEVTNNQTSEVTTYNYYYDEEDRLVTETFGNTRYDYLYNGDDLYGFVKNLNERYYYIKDITNNILGIVDSSGTILGKYNYDAYGNIISNTVSIENHITYKCYYYDNEIEMYYLRSRFYVPKWRRFLTPDSINYLEYTDFNKINLYAYCGNNPVMNVDPDGHIFITSLLVAAGLGSALGALFNVGEQLLQNNFNFTSLNGWEILGGALKGAAAGVAITLGGAAGLASLGMEVTGYSLSLGMSATLAIGTSTLASVGAYSLSTIGKNNWNLNDACFAAGEGLIDGLISFGMGFYGGKIGIFNGLEKSVSHSFYSNTSMTNSRFITYASQSLVGEKTTKGAYSILVAILRWLI